MSLPVARDPLATYDSLGRKQASRGLGFIQLLRAYPFILEEFDKEVPDSHLRLSVEGPQNGGMIAIVSCVCEQEVTVLFNKVLRCPGGGCRRWFFFTGKKVMVAREPPGPEGPTEQLSS